MKKTFWDRVAPLYDWSARTNAAAVDGMAAAVAKRIPEGAEMLECAAGTGEVSIAAAPKAGRILCTDLSLPMLEQARIKAARLGHGNIAFAQRNLLHLEDPDGRFDVAVAANVLHLLDQPEDAVRELWRVTKPGGLVVLPTFLLGEAGWFYKNAIKLYRVLGFRPKHYFTRRSYQAMLDGLELGKVQYTLVKGRLPVGLAVLTKV